MQLWIPGSEALNRPTKPWTVNQSCLISCLIDNQELLLRETRHSNAGMFLPKTFGMASREFFLCSEVSSRCSKSLPKSRQTIKPTMRFTRMSQLRMRQPRGHICWHCRISCDRDRVRNWIHSCSCAILLPRAKGCSIEGAQIGRLPIKKQLRNPGSTIFSHSTTKIT